jgi:hypothetical protein
VTFDENVSSDDDDDGKRCGECRDPIDESKKVSFIRFVERVLEFASHVYSYNVFKRQPSWNSLPMTNTRLLRKYVIYGQKKFYNIGPWTQLDV